LDLAKTIVTTDPSILKPLSRHGWRKFSRGGIAVMLILGVIAWEGSRKTPTPPAEGVSLRGVTSSATPQSLRIGIFNIAGGVGADGKRDLHRTVETLQGCDIVGLNEVHAGLPWQHSNQADWLGGQLRMASLFAPTERRWWQEDFGNGILSKLPCAHWQRFPLSTALARSHRNVLLVRLRYEGRYINVLVTHLDRHEDHDIEMRSIAELFLSLAEPAILLGDLNASSREHEIIRLQHTAGVLDVTGESAVEHCDSDWIFARGFRCIKAGLLEKGASDHPFYWADLTLE
jgi:endonuclease/exonuclease/phosphatase family metal-dependent hydrolase